MRFPVSPFQLDTWHRKKRLWAFDLKATAASLRRGDLDNCAPPDVGHNLGRFTKGEGPDKRVVAELHRSRVLHFVQLLTQRGGAGGGCSTGNLSFLAPTLTKAAPAQEVKRNWNHSCCDKSRAVTAMSLLLWGNKLRCPTRIIPLHPIGMSRNIQVMGQYGYWPHISRMPHSPFNIFTCLYQSSWISILVERGVRLLLLSVYSVLKSNFVHYMNINTTSLVTWIKRSQKSQIFWSILDL